MPECRSPRPPLALASQVSPNRRWRSTSAGRQQNATHLFCRVNGTTVQCYAMVPPLAAAYRAARGGARAATVCTVRYQMMRNIRTTVTTTSSHHSGQGSALAGAHALATQTAHRRLPSTRGVQSRGKGDTGAGEAGQHWPRTAGPQRNNNKNQHGCGQHSATPRGSCPRGPAPRLFIR